MLKCTGWWVGYRGAYPAPRDGAMGALDTAGAAGADFRGPDLNCSGPSKLWVRFCGLEASDLTLLDLRFRVPEPEVLKSRTDIELDDSCPEASKECWPSYSTV